MTYFFGYRHPQTHPGRLDIVAGLVADFVADVVRADRENQEAREVKFKASVLNSEKLFATTKSVTPRKALLATTYDQRKRSDDGDHGGDEQPGSFARGELLCERESRGCVYDESSAADKCVS